jgi:small subunit ribosomal protein S6
MRQDAEEVVDSDTHSQVTGELSSGAVIRYQIACFLPWTQTFTIQGHQPRGGDTMKAYELLFFVDPTSNEETRAGVMKRIEVAITTDGGTVDSVEDWGKRKLAYEIDHLTEGDYTLINFHADPSQIAELDRVLRISDAVKRHMIVARTDKD